MAHRALWWVLLLQPVLSAPQCANTECAEDGSSLLALQRQRHGAQKVRKLECPGSGFACVPDECCPAYKGSDEMTFPCPGSSPGWDMCETASGSSQTASMSSPSQAASMSSATWPAPSAECPGSGFSCAGNECCPAFTGSDGATFPCPSATPGWNMCGSATQEERMAGPPHLGPSEAR
mmetsp:Transcript_45345/g.117386  ORF Transcript_45345/g.117386 Transcript_45345/m.117386 type:complete len:178 (-) Transcript_45345:282-815(-)|eukprot:CAMPEP_0195104508 /NCGR_PEP_ID=MMETSP0448-20130528/73140_1 /TAXON_ID=66468 /ORGANISM="Heterocapsa triquestra, Strain CCMP 448" /LENGTH=177 /DNA_ID=CAMNT_0040140353 /DNA_START=61 /DNA_END=594 /DNA_ORIENTATION=-